MSQENFVTIRNYSDHILAEIIIAALHNGGIETFALTDNHSMLPTDRIEVKVREEDAVTAIEIIERHESL